MKETPFSKVYNWFRRNFVFFGPGILLAITAAGEAGITEAIEIGAHYSLALIWAVIITLLFKFAFTNGIARYTLATGHTIFEALNNLPGPKNWGPILITVSYIIETISVGAMILFSATFLDYLFPGVYSLVLISIFLLFVALAILRTHIYHYFELLMAILVIVLAFGLIFSLVDFPVSPSMILSGIIPNIPTGSEMAILAIIGVVGSGLNLMLYSVWLQEKTKRHDDKSQDSCDLHNEVFFKKYIRSVNIDIIIGFLFVALITVGFMFLGYAGFAVSFMPHGSTLTLDIIISQVLYIFRSIPYGMYLFLVIVAVIFFGAAVIGIDARAKALSKVAVSTGVTFRGKLLKEPTVYQIAILSFSVIILITFLIGNPMGIIRSMAVICAILFGIFGFILLYINSKLPEYAKGGRGWITVIGIGSFLSIYTALLIEGAFLKAGIPMIEKMLICSVVFIIFCRSNMFKKLVSGKASILDKLWMIIIFGIISIYGTYGGVSMGDYIINFRDLGAMLAGIIGGPIAGGVVGLIGGIYRFTLGGPTAVPCLIATIAAGFAAGIAIRLWKGSITPLRLIILGLLVECMHLLLIFPSFSLALGTMDLPAIRTVIVSTVLPMSAVNCAGLLIFAYISKDVKIFASGLAKFNPKSALNEIMLMTRMKKPDDKK